jgi:hypothetical protein
MEMPRHAFELCSGRAIDVEEPLEPRSRALRQGGSDRLEHRSIAACERFTQQLGPLSVQFSRPLSSDLLKQVSDEPEG